MRSILASLLLTALAACGDGGADVPPDAPADAPSICFFPSGRPCPSGHACMNTQGDECSYVACRDGRLEGAPVACMPGPITPSGTGPHDCDPTHVPAPGGLLTPPSGPCPIGGLYTIVNNFWRTCVPVAECAPLPCDPQWNGDGCPSAHRCDATSRTCVPS